MDGARMEAIVGQYSAAANGMFAGLKQRMAIYSGCGDPASVIAAHFVAAGGTLD